MDKEISKLFSEAVEKLDRVDTERDEQLRALVIKYIEGLNIIKYPKEKIPSTVVTQFNMPDLVTERFVHECLLKMDDKEGT